MNTCARCLAGKPDSELDVLPGGARICRAYCLATTPDMFRVQQKPGGCWTCVYQKWQNPEDATFFGTCRYFETIGKPAKEIPREVVDRGCKYKKEKPPRGIETAGSI